MGERCVPLMQSFASRRPRVGAGATDDEVGEAAGAEEMIEAAADEKVGAGTEDDTVVGKPQLLLFLALQSHDKRRTGVEVIALRMSLGNPALDELRTATCLGKSKELQKQMSLVNGGSPVAMLSPDETANHHRMGRVPVGAQELVTLLVADTVQPRVADV